MSSAEAKPADDLDEPNEATVIRKPVEATAPEAVEDVPDAEQTSLSLPRISAYGDEDRPGPASSIAATTDDEPVERTSRRQSPDVEEKLDTDEPDGSTAIRPTYAPPSAPPPTTPPPAEEPAAEEAVIPDPEPRPIPDPSPFPEPEPVPGPEPVPDPEPTPTPIPEPGPVPEPDPVPGPDPVPDPEPEPVSEATAEAAYQPFVQPSGKLVQEQRNGQARHWAPQETAVAETAADQLYETEPAYATGYAEGGYATEGSADWQNGYGYAGEQEPIEQDFGDYGTQQEYVSSLMAAESEDNPSTWIVLLWVGAIFMIVLLVLGVWLMTL